MLTAIKPSLRVSHYYRFAPEKNESESCRIGYCYAFHLCEGGRGRLVINGKAYPLSKGTLAFIPPLREHSFLSDSSDPLETCNAYCELWTNQPQVTLKHITWNPNEIEKEYVTPIVDCPELEMLPPTMPLIHDPMLVSIFRKIVQLHKHDDELSQKMSRDYLSGWIINICEMQHHMPYYDYRIQKLLQQLERSNDEDQGEDWAERCGLKKSQFHILFKNMTGLTPHAYRLKRKMDRAAAILLESSKSITEIAAILGYPSIHQFSRQFSDRFGVSPTIYRHGTSVEPKPLTGGKP